MVKDFIVSIQEEFTLKHVNFLTSENPIEFLGRSIKRLKNGNITMEFSQKFIDELLKIFEVTGKVTTNRSQASSSFQKIRRFSVIVSFIKSIDQRLGKLLWMAQLRDDHKYPVKELSRSLINPQDQDVKNLVHLLKYVNQTRDFVFVMEPQLPVRNQEGKFPVQIVSYSDSDWAGCQKSRRSTSGSLISVFNINIQSTSRTQASIAHSSAESELYAMTQASVESLAIKNFIQEFSSAILSASVSIVIQTDSSAGKSMASRLGISRRSKHIELKYLWIQDEIKEGKLELKKVGTHFNPRAQILQTFSQNMFQLQFLVNIFLVSISSRFLPKDQNQFFCQHTQVNQFSVHPTLSHPQHQLHRSRRRRCQSSCSLSTLIIKSIFVRDSVKHHEASEEFSHLLVEGAEIKNQMLFVVSMSVIKNQKFKRIKIQKSGNQFMKIQIQVFMVSDMFLLRIMSRRVSGVHGSDHVSVCQCH